MESIMTKRWHFQPHDASQVQFLQRAGDIAPVVAQLLVSRGVTDPKLANKFLDAKLSDLRDPELLPGVEEAAARLHRAVVDEESIMIYGDYDADGMTSTSIMMRGLQALHSDVSYYVPNRIVEGYGLNMAAIDQIAATGAKLLITVDCGITSVDEVAHAKELGMDVIVTDHHEMAATLPAADAIVHPNLPGHDYPFVGLCGAGVAFKLMWRVCQLQSDAKRVSERLRNYLLGAMGLAAIGTVADVVPLVDENRVIVRHGLKTIKASPSIGLEALMKVTGVDKKPQLGSDDIGFMLGPRLNAAGRLGKGEVAIELLTTESYERAAELAQQIDELNTQRVEVEREILQAARTQVREQFSPAEDHTALVLSGVGWHPGVIGIVAGRIAEQFYRPTFVITESENGEQLAMGSGRSIPGFNLNNALQHCTEHLVGHGGHAAAAGLRMDGAKIPAFRESLRKYAASVLSPEEFLPRLKIDAEASLQSLTLRTVKQLEQLAPFGQANRRPTLCARGVSLGNPPKRMGRGEKHLSVTLQQNEVKLRAVAFNQAEWVEPMTQLEGMMDVAFRPVLNEYNGRRSVELQIVDWKPAEKLGSIAG